MSTKATCENCAYSLMMRLGDNTIEKTRVCKRSPPQLFSTFTQTPQGIAMQTASMWPAVGDDDWCHEFWNGIDPDAPPLAA